MVSYLLSLVMDRYLSRRCCNQLLHVVVDWRLENKSRLPHHSRMIHGYGVKLSHSAGVLFHIENTRASDRYLGRYLYCYRTLVGTLDKTPSFRT